MPSTKLRWLALLTLYVCLTLIFAFPLAFRAEDSIVAQTYNDSYYSVWIFGWEADALIRDPLHLFDANIYWPLKNTLAFSEIILPEAVMFLPLSLASANPLWAYNLVLLALFPLNALAMHAWVYYNLRDHRAAFLAGVLFAFCTYKLGELRHIQLVAAQWMPLTLLYTQKFIQRPIGKNIFLALLFFLLNALTAWYYAVIFSFGLALFLVWQLVTRAWKINRRHLLYGGIGVALLILVLIPFILPFINSERELSFSAERDARTFSARPASYLATVASNPIYSPLFAALEPFYVSRGQPLFPGLLALALALVGLVSAPRMPRARFYVALVVMAFVFSFGPVLILTRENQTALSLPLPYAWLDFLPGLKSMTAPARFAILIMLGLAMLAARGAQVLSARLARHHLIVWGALVCLVGVEHFASPLPLRQVNIGEKIPPVYQYLAQQPLTDPVVEIPMGQPTYSDSTRFGAYVYYSLYHRHLLVNGYSSFLPAPYAELVEAELDFPEPAAVDTLREYDVVWIIVHSKDTPAFARDPRALSDALAAQPDLTLVKQFDDIWLYRIER